MGRWPNLQAIKLAPYPRRDPIPGCNYGDSVDFLLQIARIPNIHTSVLAFGPSHICWLPADVEFVLFTVW